jgi:uncharacterized repeat protein (TIGR01451 family)
MSRIGRWLAVTVPLVVGASVALSSTALAGGSTVRDAVYPSGADLAVTIATTPYSVTAGNDASFDVTVTDRGTKAAQGVTLTDTLPAGQAFVVAVPSQGTCTELNGVVACVLGDVPVAAHAVVHIIIATTTTPSILVDKAAVVHGSPSDPVKTNNHTTHYLSTYAPNPDYTDGYMPPAGGSVGTGRGTSLLNPTSTVVRGPRTVIGFGVEIYEYTPYSPTDGCGSGFTCFGQLVSVYGLSGISVAHPATIRLTFNHTAIPAGKSIDHTRLFDRGAIVPRCFTGATGAQPDPCVSSRTLLASGNWQLTVRATQSDHYFRI